MLVIGMISGTSADGVDVAIVDIQGKGDSLKISEKAFKTYKYPNWLQDRIVRIVHERIKLEEIAVLNFYIGKFFAKSALRLVKESGIPLKKIELVGSHGQTIFHMPGIATLQIGEPSVIARMLGIVTVADFRPADIAVGGEGAPLSCLLHYHLFKEKGLGTLVINIGGISNFTLIPRNGKIDSVLAFDTGPGNMIIDGLVSFKTGGRLRYDRHGKIAFSGMVLTDLLEELLRHPFILKKPPKSTGREEFGLHQVEELKARMRKGRLKFNDVVATATALTVESINLNYLRFIKDRYKVDRVVVTGGGVKNRFIMKLLREKFYPIHVYTFEDFGLNSDSTEAVAFALLAYETFYRRPGNIPSATGANKRVILGKIIYP